LLSLTYGKGGKARETLLEKEGKKFLSMLDKNAFKKKKNNFEKTEYLQIKFLKNLMNRKYLMNRKCVLP